MCEKSITKERLIYHLRMSRTENRVRMAIMAAKRRLKWAKQRASEERAEGNYFNFSKTYKDLANMETMTIRQLKRLLPRQEGAKDNAKI